MDTGPDYSLTPASSSSSQELGMALSPTSPTPKRPAGRTKFKETRHPVYRGVRRRGSNGRWVCEVRVPSQPRQRLWLGTHVTAEAAARAHDAAMLAMHGRTSAACLNFPDSAWLLDVPSTLTDLDDIRRAAVGAVVEFLRQDGTRAAAAAEAVPVDGVASAPLAPSPYADNANSSATSQPSAASTQVSAALGSDMFELHISGEMSLDSYYADLAERLLLEPPPPAEHGGDCGDGGGHDASLWKWNH